MKLSRNCVVNSLVELLLATYRAPDFTAPGATEVLNFSQTYTTASASAGRRSMFFGVESLLDQSKSSLETAVEVHPSLTKYVICFPFDLTGPTRRDGRSGVEKIEDWKQIQEQCLVADGRTLNIEFWPAFKIRDLPAFVRYFWRSI